MRIAHLTACASLAALAWLAPGIALSADAPAGPSRALIEPVRVTAGEKNQMMGELTPDQKTLYFISDENQIHEIFVQDPVESGPKLLFENNADASTPRISPDGKMLAFLSYKADAAGDVCVMTLKSKEQRCLTGLDTAELAVFWMDQGKTLGVVSRAGVHGDYQVLRFRLDGDSKKPEKVLEQNLMDPDLSPDGKVLAFVPLEKTQKEVGVSFSNRTGKGLMLKALAGSAGPLHYKPDLPGVTGSPAFAKDGEFLYFVQYLNDTNQDGTTDGNDNSILFRVPVDPKTSLPLDGATPDQLTSAQWNCKYPALATDKLLVTCSHQGSLDIYYLPLTGSVPPDWDIARLEQESYIARNHWIKLLLLARELSLEKDPEKKTDVLTRMTQLHVELGEVESADFYCGQIERLLKANPASPKVYWAAIMQELVQHRSNANELSQGQRSERFSKEAKARADRIKARLTSAPGYAESALTELVLSEILDDVGEKLQALKRFEGLELDKIDDPLVVNTYAQRARELYELRAERDKLLAVYQKLAAHPKLTSLDRLRYAEYFVRELFRGEPTARRQELAREWIPKLDPESETALMLTVSTLLLPLDVKTEEEINKTLFELYKKTKDKDRRKALVLTTISEAARTNTSLMQAQFINTWASYLKRSDPERKYAEDLFSSIFLERAYTELSKSNLPSARAVFNNVGTQTLTLEANIGFIDTALSEGKIDPRKKYVEEFAKDQNNPVYLFVQAYFIVRDLRAQKDAKAQLKEIDKALSLLEQPAKTWPRNLEVQQLWGYLLHQRYFLSGDGQDAISANSHYLLALDLARDNPRYQATLYLQLGLLQSSLGNHRIALEYLAERDRLPQVSPERELTLRLALARSLFQADSEKQAVEQVHKALALLDKQPSLGKYKPLVLDRAAFYELSAQNADKALTHYQALLALVDKASADDMGAPINRIKVRIGLVRALMDTKQYDKALEEIRAIEPMLKAGKLRPEAKDGRSDKLLSARYKPGAEEYAMWVAGLEARSNRAMEKYANASSAMQRRQKLYATRFDDQENKDDLLEVASASYDLGEYSYRQKNLQVALQHFEEGLTESDKYNELTGSEVNPVQLRLLQAYAELHLYGKLALTQYHQDLRGRLEKAYDFICKNPSPNWEKDRFLFELYLTMLDVSKP